MKFKVLIDTNVLIHSEDNKIIDVEIQKFHSHSNHYEIYIHKRTFQDLENDKNEDRKNIIKAKIGKYKLLPFSKEPDDDFYEIIDKPKKSNDFIDDNILYSIQKKLCNYLITEDRNIHTKAYKLGVGDRVFSIRSFNDFIISQFNEGQVTNTFKDVEHTEVFNVAPDCKDEIFRSLRNDYIGFDQWFSNKVILQHRKGFFILTQQKQISGMCIYDLDNDDYPDGIKISTFKVSDILGGQKRGELLIRQIMIFALEKKKNNLYVEVKKDKEFFIQWLISFGFEVVGCKKTDKDSFILKKSIIGNCIEGEVVKNYPQFYIGDSTSIFLVPIQQIYANKLFPNSQTQYTIPFEVLPTMNTIKKSYVFKKKNNSIKKGDIVLFYQTGTEKVNKYETNQKLISFGIIEDYKYTQDISEAITFISKRSVYNVNEIEGMIGDTGISIINFRYCDDFYEELNYEKLIQMNILKGVPQSLLKIENPIIAFSKIKKYLGSYYQ